MCELITSIIPMLPDGDETLLKFLLPCILTMMDCVPWNCGQNKPFLPEAAFVGYPITATRERTNVPELDSQLLFQFAFYCCDKDTEQRQFGEQRVYFYLYFQVTRLILARGGRAGTEAETTEEEHCLLVPLWHVFS